MVPAERDIIEVAMQSLPNSTAPSQKRPGGRRLQHLQFHDEDSLKNDLEHAAQLVAAFALRLPERAIAFGKAARLAYVADRESMRRHGFPIIDDIRIAAGGALNMKVLRTGRDGCIPLLAERPLLSVIGEGCRLDPAVGVDDLDLFSIADNAVLDQVVGGWGDLEVDEIDRKMRDEFPELSQLDAGMEVSERAIFAAVGSDDPDGDAERLQSFRQIDHLFAALSAP